MSDYLSNLAARSLHAVAMIRPRLASFYEAPQPGFALPTEPVEADRAEHPPVDAAKAGAAKAEPAQSRPALESMVRPTPPAAANAPRSAGDATPRTQAIMPALAPVDASATPASSDEPSMPRPAAQRVSTLSASRPSPAPPVVDDVPGGVLHEQRGHREAPSPIAAGDRSVEREPDSLTYIEMSQADRIAVRVASPEREGEAGLPHIETAPPHFEPGSPHLEPGSSAIATARRRPAAYPETLRLSLSSPAEPPHATPSHRAEPDRVAPRPERRNEGASETAPSLPGREPQSIPPMPRITPVRIVAEPHQPQRVQPVPRPPRPLHPPPAAPDVHVTIGRVEVRAIPAAEPPSRGRAVPPSSRMSLDDYLRKRDERTRR